MRKIYSPWVGVFLLVVASTAFAELRVATLPKVAADFAMDEVRGTTAVVYPELDKIVFYPRLWEGPSDGKEVTIGKTPVAVAFKRFKKQDLFVAVCRDDGRMFVFDAATQTLIKDAKLSLAMVSSVETSLNPADPYVYYCGGGGHDSRVGQFNVETMEDHGAVAMPGGMGSSSSRAYVSADGTILYTLGPWSPTGFQCYRIGTRTSPRDPTTAMQITYEHDSRGGYVPDRFATSVGAGSRIYSPDLRETLVDLRETVLAFAPYEPGVVTINENGLSIWSTNTYKLASTVVLPKDIREASRDVVTYRRLAPAQGTVLWEPSRRFAMFCQQDKVLAIPAAEFSVSEPMLGVDISGALNASVGTPITVTLAPRTTGTVVTLDSGPKGMTVNGGTLAWTPAADDVGPQEAVLSLRHNDTVKKQKLSLTVSRPYLLLPFVGEVMAATPDGKRALLCRTASERNRMMDTADQGSTICVIDLDTGKVLAQRQIPQPVACAELDRQFVYVSLADSDAVFIWSAADLTDVRRVFAPSRVSRMKSVAGKLFMAGAQGGTTVLSIPGFEPDTGLFAPVQAMLPGMAAPAELPVWLGSGWLWRGLKFDTEMKNVLSVRSNGPLVEAIPAGAPTPPQNRASPGRWPVTASGQQLRRAGGQAITQVGNEGNGTSGIVVLDSLPIAAVTSVRVQGSNGLNAGATRVSVEFRDLVSGQVRAQQTLMLEAVNLINVPDGYMRVGVAECVSGGRLLVRFRDRLFVLALNEKWAQGVEPPLTIQPQDGVIVLSNAGARIVTVAIPGAAKMQYALRREAPGVNLDTATGAVTFDLEALRKQAANALLTQLEANGASAEDRLADYRRTAVAYFRSVTSRDATGIPVAVPVEVVGHDAQLQQASCRTVAFLEVAPGEVEPRLQAKATAMPAPQAPDAGAQPLEQRVAQLEQQVKILQAKIDTLTELLRKGQ